MFRVGLFSNLWVIFGVAGMILLQGLFTYWPPMQALFNTEAIGRNEWLLILSAGLIIYSTIGFEKWLLRRMK